MDIVDRATRSRMMSGIRGRNTQPEVQVRRFLSAAGFRYRLHVRGLPGRPDIVLHKYRTVILIHGCFWHQHRGCNLAYMPKSNRSFWRTKLRGNAARDIANGKALKALGWRVVTVWECQLSERHLQGVVRRLRRYLSE